MVPYFGGGGGGGGGGDKKVKEFEDKVNTNIREVKRSDENEENMR